MSRTNFISGLPRSGSTLSSALLRAGKRFAGDLRARVAAWPTVMTGDTSGRRASLVLFDDAPQRRLFTSAGEPVCVGGEPDARSDRHTRPACARAGDRRGFLLAEGDPLRASRLQVAVRIQSLIHASTFRLSPVFYFAADGTVFTRADGGTAGDGMADFACDALKETCLAARAGQWMSVQHAMRSIDPVRVETACDDAIHEPALQHDFKCMPCDAEAFENAAGAQGLHTIRPGIRAQARKAVFPPSVFHRFDNDAFGCNPDTSLHQNRIV